MLGAVALRGERSGHRTVGGRRTQVAVLRPTGEEAARERISAAGRIDHLARHRRNPDELLVGRPKGEGAIGAELDADDRSA